MQTPVAVGGCGCVLSTEFTHRQASQQAKLQIWRCGEQQAWRLLQGAREGALWAAMSPQTDARSRMPREFGTHKLAKQATLSYLDNYDHVLNFLATLNVNLLHDHEQHARSRSYAGDPWAPDDLLIYNGSSTAAVQVGLEEEEKEAWSAQSMPCHHPHNLPQQWNNFLIHLRRCFRQYWIF